MSESGAGGNRLAAIKILLEGGVPKLFENYGTPERVSHYLINAYAHSWLQLDSFIFAGNDRLRAEQEPEEQVMAVFERTWDSRTHPEVKDYALFALLGHYSIGEGNTLSELLFTNGESESSDDVHALETINKLEDICRRGDLHEDPHYLAHLLVNYAASVFVGWAIQPPEEGGFSVTEAQLGVRVILTGGQPTELS